ncbi:MAG: hypothetical protein EOO62_20425 [Hymenobacter sp.]|nr:MAG: hypothetical protein EOO62_20425 [Hymenobacter sp.]
MHTLRVDSAYATADGDSVYTFNRLLRAAPGGAGYPLFRSRNNLLGARLRWRPGTSDYYLEANAEPALGSPAAPVALLLRPRVALGSTWAASTAPALTATLTSRTLGTVGNAPDSLATITLSNGQLLLLSKRNGLLQGPQWLTLSASGTTPPPTWQQYGPATNPLGPYDPRTLFAFGVGDEVGYQLTAPWFATVSCQHGYQLRRIIARQETTDSLILTYREQDVVTTTNAPNCSGTPGTAFSAIRTGRWAFSLRTGASPQWPFMGLLAGEYRKVPGITAWLTGRGYDLELRTGSCLLEAEPMSFWGVYGAGSTGPYLPGIDYLALNQTFTTTLGVGPEYFTDYYENTLAYYRRGNVSCGQPLYFAGLLATHAARAATAATLAPNPATEAATLTLAAPAPPQAVLALTDALGRQMWHTPVATGQLKVTIPLAGTPAGLYLVQLLVPAAPPLTWKLVRQ